MNTKKKKKKELNNDTFGNDSLTINSIIEEEQVIKFRPIIFLNY